MEVDLPNSSGQIIPGSYVNVSINTPGAGGPHPQVPSEALVIKNNKTVIPVIGSDSTLKYVPVKAGENDGVNVTILDGIHTGDLIGLNVGGGFNDGQKVRVQP